MLRTSLISCCAAACFFCGVLGHTGNAAADVVVPGALDVGSLKFGDGTSQSTASGVTKVWSGVANTHVSASGGSGAYLYTVITPPTGAGVCTIFFNYLGQVCVVSSQSGDKSCVVYGQSGNSTTIHCTKHSDNTLVDSDFAFICLAP
jgi:hypothetical protein